MGIKIEDVKRLTLGPNDALVVTLPERASARHFHEVQELVKGLFPSNRVLVVPKDVEILVVTEDQG